MTLDAVVLARNRTEMGSDGCAIVLGVGELTRTGGTVVSNHTSAGTTLALQFMERTIQHCIVAFNHGRVFGEWTSDVSVRCSDVFGNSSGCGFAGVLKRLDGFRVVTGLEQGRDLLMVRDRLRSVARHTQGGQFEGGDSLAQPGQFMEQCLVRARLDEMAVPARVRLERIERFRARPVQIRIGRRNAEMRAGAVLDSFDQEVSRWSNVDGVRNGAKVRRPTT